MPEHDPENPPQDGSPARGPRTGRDAARNRIRHQTQWVEQQLRVAMERGEFDDLPGAGKPIEDLGTEHDPDWWLKKLIERERISGVLPEALQLRKDDLEIEALLDRQPNEAHVRKELESFNARIVRARMQLQGGPPVITPTRDVEAEVTAWRERRRRPSR
jgi:hypothetical protein